MTTDEFSIAAERVRELAYGENYYQSPVVLYATRGDADPLSIHRFESVGGGRAPGFINLADLDRLVDVVALAAAAFRKNCGGQMPHLAVIGKHGNPCGFAADWQSPETAIGKALAGDPLAAMGGEMVVTFPIDDHLARALVKSSAGHRLAAARNWLLDIVAAPAFAPEAVERLGRREKRRLLVNPALAAPTLHTAPIVRPVRGGLLVQPAADFVVDLFGTDPPAVDWVSCDARADGLPDERRDSLLVAFSVAWRASSNTVALVNDRMLLGLGVGQQDRVGCIQLAATRAIRSAMLRRAATDEEWQRCIHEAWTHYGDPDWVEAAHLRGSTFASDAFFPFTDSPRELTDPDRVGCTAGIAVADGEELPTVRAFFAERGTLVALVPRKYRGFARH